MNTKPNAECGVSAQSRRMTRMHCTHAAHGTHGAGHVSRACMPTHTRVLAREQETRPPSGRGDTSGDALVLRGRRLLVLCWVSLMRSCDSIQCCNGEVVSINALQFHTGLHQTRYLEVFWVSLDTRAPRQRSVRPGMSRRTGPDSVTVLWAGGRSNPPPAWCLSGAQPGNEAPLRSCPRTNVRTRSVTLAPHNAHMSLRGSQERRHHRSGWQPLRNVDEQGESASLWPSRTEASPSSVTGLEPVRVALGTGSKKPSKSQLRRLQASSTVPSVMLPVTGCALKLALSPPPAPLREHNHQWYCVASVSSSPLTTSNSDENTTHADGASPPKRLYFLNRDQGTYRTSACKSLGAGIRVPAQTVKTSDASRPGHTHNSEATLPGSLKEGGKHSHSQMRDSCTPERVDGLSLRPLGTSVDVTEGAPGSDPPILERRCSTDGRHSRHSSLDPVEFRGGVELERGGSPALASSSVRAGSLIAHHRKGSIIYFRPNEPMITPPRHARSASIALCSNASSRGVRLDEDSPERPGGQTRPSPHRLQHHAEELLLANVRFLGERVRELEERVAFLEQENESLRHALSAATQPAVEATNVTINPGGCSNDGLR